MGQPVKKARRKVNKGPGQGGRSSQRDGLSANMSIMGSPSKRKSVKRNASVMSGEGSEGSDGSSRSSWSSHVR